MLVGWLHQSLCVKGRRGRASRSRLVFVDCSWPMGDEEFQKLLGRMWGLWI